MRNKSYIILILLHIALFIIAILTGCSNTSSSNQYAGGTIETTNGAVASNVEVKIVPSDFNPLTDDESRIITTTTDENGAYQLIIPAPGSYNIEVLNTEDGTRALLKEAVLSMETDKMPLIQLTHPGVFIINVPDSLSEEHVFYLSGTTYKWDRSGLDTVSDGSLVFRDLPAGALTSLETNTNTLISEVPVNSQDSTYHDLALTWRSFTTSNSSIPSDHITSIFTDNNGLHWIATWGGGVGVHSDDLKGLFEQSKAVIPSNYTKDLVIDKNGTTIIATNAGLQIYNDSTAIARTFNVSNSAISSNNVKCLALDSTLGCWIGTDSGLDYLDYSKLSIAKWANYQPGTDINDVTVDKDNNVWVATASEGIKVFDSLSWKSYNSTNDLASNAVYSLIQRTNGDIVAAHENGKLSINNGNTWNIVTNKQSSAETMTILCFYETSKGVLYVGTEGGLIRLEDGYWKRTTGTVFDELKGCKVTTISDDSDGNMWVGTESKGVYVFGLNAQDIIFKRALHLRAF